MGDFTMTFVSEEGREYLVLEVCFRSQRLFQISKEDEDEAMQIEFLTDLYLLKEEVKLKFSFSDFEKALEDAKSTFLRARDR
ncbi:hypothetical protein [Rudaea cellulosilytica]|uniref:hypothetical protein n=1 Tax=Rudaea cellulosilytica TaxID=540746 RepID=UPI00037CBD63|nr:hypothetical protein [Rudaea cellulosilytica]